MMPSCSDFESFKKISRFNCVPFHLFSGKANKSTITRGNQCWWNHVKTEITRINADLFNKYPIACECCREWASELIKFCYFYSNAVSNLFFLWRKMKQLLFLFLHCTMDKLNVFNLLFRNLYIGFRAVFFCRVEKFKNK